MKAALLVPFGLLAACGQPQGGDNATNTAAPAAQSTPVAATTPTQPADAASGLPEAVPTPVSSAAPPLAETVSEAPFTPDSPQGAANVVQTYFALIEAGKYRQAWHLWRDDGQASGMSAAAFAQSFAKYTQYHATVGAPGRIDAGAGQRYVTVPVKTYGTLKTGKPFAMDGSVTLHRTGDIDGATAEQKSWHISASDLKPRPADTAGLPASAPARYTCTGNFAFTARFDNRAGTATLSRNGKTLATLDQQRAASGIWYRGQGYDLRGKGNAATLIRPNGKPLDCTAS